MIELIGVRMNKLEQRIKNEAKTVKAIEVMDKTELAKLNQGAEDTSTSEEEYDSESEEAKKRE